MKRIIFFDGKCPVCNGFVNFILKRDKTHQFLFCSLQSEEAKNRLSNQDLSLDSIIYSDDQKVHHYSTAVLRILFTLGGWYTILSMLLSIFPITFRDWIYRGFASNRTRFFGKLQTCRLPQAHEKAYFLE